MGGSREPVPLPPPPGSLLRRNGPYAVSTLTRCRSIPQAVGPDGVHQIDDDVRWVAEQLMRPCCLLCGGLHCWCRNGGSAQRETPGGVGVRAPGLGPERDPHQSRILVGQGQYCPWSAEGELHRDGLRIPCSKSLCNKSQVLILLSIRRFQVESAVRGQSPRWNVCVAPEPMTSFSASRSLEAAKGLSPIGESNSVPRCGQGPYVLDSVDLCRRVMVGVAETPGDSLQTPGVRRGPGAGTCPARGRAPPTPAGLC